MIQTGGTIEKTYDEFSGLLQNRVSVLDVMLSSLVLEGVRVDRVPLMNKDSLEMGDADYELIAVTAAQWAATHDGVVIVHGTDRLADSGHRVYERVPDPPAPVVFTGAMRPYALRTTDALQNMTEALLAVQLLRPGVYVCMHNRVLEFPGVVKDRVNGTFARGEWKPTGSGDSGGGA